MTALSVVSARGGRSRAIRLHDKLLICCSEASLESWWVKDEIRKAQERERKEGRGIIIPAISENSAGTLDSVGQIARYS